MGAKPVLTTRVCRCARDSLIKLSLSSSLMLAIFFVRVFSSLLTLRSPVYLYSLTFTVFSKGFRSLPFKLLPLSAYPSLMPLVPAPLVTGFFRRTGYSSASAFWDLGSIFCAASSAAANSSSFWVSESLSDRASA